MSSYFDCELPSKQLICVCILYRICSSFKDVIEQFLKHWNDLNKQINLSEADHYRYDSETMHFEMFS